MNISEILENYSVEIATLENHYNWVKTNAREIDLETEMHLVIKLDQIMHYFRDLYKFAGVSSNNIYWNLTEIPIRVMLIPVAQRRYHTIINPKYLGLTGKEISNVEACGSVPDNNNYIIKRKPYVLISGYTLEKNILNWNMYPRIKFDQYLLNDLCRLNSDETFFKGVEPHDPDSLHPYLIKYLIHKTSGANIESAPPRLSYLRFPL